MMILRRTRRWLWGAGTGLWSEEEGIGTLEIVLIAAVLILVAILFKDWIMAFLRDLMGSAEDKAGTIFD
jgi:hypothetical protein